MKKILSFILAFSMSLAAFAQPATQNISEKVKVTFPGKPEEMKAPNGLTMYSYQKDSSVSFKAMSLDVSAMGLTAEMITSYGDALWDQIKGGMGAQMGGATVDKDAMEQFKGKNSLYIEINGTNSIAPEIKGKKAYGYLFFIGTVLHQVLYFSGDPKSKKEDGASFFDSVTIVE